MFPDQEPGKPRRYMERRLGPQHGGSRGKPLVHWRRIVVDDVVNALALLDRKCGRFRGIVDVNERPPCRATADHWHAVLAELLDDHGFEQAGVGTVEAAITRHDACRRCSLGDDVFQIANSFESPSLLLRRIRIERVVLGLDVPTSARIRPTAVTLRDKTFDPARGAALADVRVRAVTL